MHINRREHLKQSGIYAIVNVVEDRIYIGSSGNLYGRKQWHLDDLRRGGHKNQSLQVAFNNFGEIAFIFIVLELVDKSLLIEKEQKYLDLFAPTQLYNSSRYAGSTKGCRRTESAKLRIGNANRGNKYWLGKHHNEDTKVKLRRYGGRQYSFVDSSGASYKGIGISNFAREHDVKYTGLMDLIYKRTDCYMGWRRGE